MIPILTTELLINGAFDYHQSLREERAAEPSLKIMKPISLFFISLICVGAGSMVFERLSKISISISMSYLSDYTIIWFIFGDFITRSLVGITYTISDNIEKHLLTTIFSVEILFATAMMIFIPSHSVILFNIV